MKQQQSTAKQPYKTPVLQVHCLAPIQMLAFSNPEVRTTNDKADVNYDALVKRDRSYSVWDDDWSE